MLDLSGVVYASLAIVLFVKLSSLSSGLVIPSMSEPAPHWHIAEASQKRQLRYKNRHMGKKAISWYI